MKFASSLLCLLALCSIAASATKFSFNGYKLVRLVPTSDDHIKLLDELENQQDFDVWNRIRGVNHNVDVALSPKAYLKYIKVFKLNKLKFEIINQNLQSLISMEERALKSASSPRNSNVVGKYARYDDIISYIKGLQRDNPELASWYSIGSTYEKKEQIVSLIKTKTSKRKIWLDCGIHAREWVSPATCIWFIDTLIKDYIKKDPVAVELLDYYEFHVLPIYNPDGYEYTHTTYRLWRKNRRPNTGSTCVGTDLNRNFNYQWMVAGSSQDPCADTYAGPSGSSELENQQVQKVIMDHKGEWDSFITLHSYGQFWMTPWGYTKALPGDYNDLLSVSKIGHEALKKEYNINYSIGSPANLLYEASGGSFDWSKAIAGIKYSICLELRPGQSGTDSRYGFLLPEDRVSKVGQETYKGLIAFVQAVKSRLTAGK